ncbi:MAG TPA: hypothetical protein VE944_28950 [Nostoc sp.]|uniref:hypothetical protein n=1 Tax=Nostoc sp. TaxID=1180 RepID=UPI002D4C5AB1|nr:hypothetical protein [Nostoc sp.]HYX18323.1 hypothetical protein [Nostoc sp.]
MSESSVMYLTGEAGCGKTSLPVLWLNLGHDTHDDQISKRRKRRLRGKHKNFGLHLK